MFCFLITSLSNKVTNTRRDSPTALSFHAWHLLSASPPWGIAQLFYQLGHGTSSVLSCTFIKSLILHSSICPTRMCHLELILIKKKREIHKYTNYKILMTYKVFLNCQILSKWATNTLFANYFLIIKWQIINTTLHFLVFCPQIKQTLLYLTESLQLFTFLRHPIKKNKRFQILQYWHLRIGFLSSK